MPWGVAQKEYLELDAPEAKFDVMIQVVVQLESVITVGFIDEFIEQVVRVRRLGKQKFLSGD